MEKDHLYAAEIAWVGPGFGSTRSYRSYSREYEVKIKGKPNLRMSADSLFLGNQDLFNPEDFLLIAISGCHMLSYLAVCAREHIEIVSYRDRATGTMILEKNNGRFSEVVLQPEVVIAHEKDLPLAQSAHETAHKTCFIANSVNFRVIHKETVIWKDQT